AGRYRIVATRPGYVRAEFGQRTTHGGGQIVALKQGEARSNIQLSMTQTGSISGRILNSSSQAAANATVQALKASWVKGRRELAVVQSTRTDELGMYRLFWLPPGQYYINVLVADADPISGLGGGDVIMNPDGKPVGQYGFGGSTGGGPGLSGAPPPPPRLLDR